MQNSHCLLCLVSGFGCNLDSTRTLPFTAQPLSIFPAEKGGKFYNFLIFGILLPPKLPDRVKPECRVNLSVDKAGKAVSRHISFYQRIPEMVMGVVCSFFYQSVCSCFVWKVTRFALSLLKILMSLSGELFTFSTQNIIV